MTVFGHRLERVVEDTTSQTAIMGNGGTPTAERTQELGAAIGHQFEVGRGHKKPKALFLEASDFSRRTRGAAQGLAMFLCRRRDFRDRLVEPALVLPAAQAEGERQVAGPDKKHVDAGRGCNLINL